MVSSRQGTFRKTDYEDAHKSLAFINLACLRKKKKGISSSSHLLFALTAHIWLFCCDSLQNTYRRHLYFAPPTKRNNIFEHTSQLCFDLFQVSFFAGLWLAKMGLWVQAWEKNQFWYCFEFKSRPGAWNISILVTVRNYSSTYWNKQIHVRLFVWLRRCRRNQFLAADHKRHFWYLISLLDFSSMRTCLRLYTPTFFFGKSHFGINATAAPMSSSPERRSQKWNSNWNPTHSD